MSLWSIVVTLYIEDIMSLWSIVVTLYRGHYVFVEYICHTLHRGHYVFGEYIHHNYDIIKNMYKNVMSVVKYSKTELSNHFHINDFVLLSTSAGVQK